MVNLDNAKKFEEHIQQVTSKENPTEEIVENMIEEIEDLNDIL